MALTAALTMLLVVGPHYLYVRSFTPELTPALYVQYQRVHVTPGMSEMADVIEIKGAVPFLLDRLKGFKFAFDPGDKRVGYFLRYYTFCYSIVAAVPLLAWLALHTALGGRVDAAGFSAIARTSREQLRAGWAWVRRPENLNWVFVVVFAVGCFTMIHSMHMHEPYPEWYFGQRHALVCMFAFFLSLVLLLAQKHPLWKLVGVAILCSGTFLGISAVHAHARDSLGARPPAGPSAFVRWLNDEAARRGGSMIVVLRQPQPIMYQTPHVGYHWYYYGTTYDDVRQMVGLGAVYVIVPGGQTYQFTRAPEFARSFHLVKTIEGYRVYEPDPSMIGVGLGAKGGGAP
jgi:hypothetical protein